MNINALAQGANSIHGSAIMIPNGEMRTRIYREENIPEPVELVTVAGNDIKYWWSHNTDQLQKLMAFTSGMTDKLDPLLPPRSLRVIDGDSLPEIMPIRSVVWRGRLVCWIQMPLWVWLHHRTTGY